MDKWIRCLQERKENSEAEGKQEIPVKETLDKSEFQLCVPAVLRRSYISLTSALSLSIGDTIMRQGQISDHLTSLMGQCWLLLSSEPSILLVTLFPHPLSCLAFLG